MDKLNIALCSSGELYGGVEQFIYTISNYLKRNAKVNVIVMLFNKGALYTKLREAKIETYVCIGHKYNFFLIKQIVKLFKEKNIGVVHTHGYKANILCGLAAKLSGVGVVKTEHGLIEPSSPSIGRFKMKCNLFLDRLVSKSCLDEIVFVSKDIENKFEKSYRQIPSEVIYNGIDAISLSNEISKARDGLFRIGIVGRLNIVKGHIYLLQALTLLEDINCIRLYVLGEGQLLNDLRNFCSRNGIADKVLFLGFKDNIYDYLAELDVFVMPSLYEGLPYALIEAMYMKRPIIASAVGGVKEVLSDHINAIIVPPGDAERLADAIKFLYENPKVRKQIGESAFETARESFTIEKMANRYIAVYSRILGKKYSSSTVA
jgi:L-malate glycosyltransferase